MSDSRQTDTYQMRLNHGLPHEEEMMAHVEETHGPLIAGIVEMRDIAIRELKSADIRSSIGGIPAFLVLIVAHAIGTLDAVRTLITHGYGRRALALVRGLYDAELDAHVIVQMGDDALSLYSAFEVWEAAVDAARLLHRTDPSNPRVISGVAERKSDLRQGLERHNAEVPKDWEEMDLVTCLEYFGKTIFGAPYPRSWRHSLKQEKLLDLVVPSHLDLFAAKPPSEVDEALLMAEDRKLRADHKLGYGLMSAVAHGSPRTLGRSAVVNEDTGQIDSIVIGGHTGDIELSGGLAALHFYRLHALAARHIPLKVDAESWDAALKQTQPSEPPRVS